MVLPKSSRSPPQATSSAGWLEKARALIFPRGTRLIAHLRAELRVRDIFIQEQAARLAHSQKIFDRSSAVARIGVWHCSLPDNRLEWTDMVYDIFDLPRGSALDRDTTVGCYAPDSVIELGIRRSRAIAERSGFSMDAEIVTHKGNRRWIRITATVECEGGQPVRIFGMKQDITEEKLMADKTRYLAAFDVMTGLANRAQFQSRLAEFCDVTPAGDAGSALMLIDLDGFKGLNDTFGHAAGDACLQETADRLRDLCHEASLIARIGGDEFAVLFSGMTDRRRLDEIARAIVHGLDVPIRRDDRCLQTSASAGVAFIDGETPEELFQKADMALYEAKAGGRNTFRVAATPAVDRQHSAA